MILLSAHVRQSSGSAGSGQCDPRWGVCLEEMEVRLTCYVRNGGASTADLFVAASS